MDFSNLIWLLKPMEKSYTSSGHRLRYSTNKLQVYSLIYYWLSDNFDMILIEISRKKSRHMHIYHRPGYISLLCQYWVSILKNLCRYFLSSVLVIHGFSITRSTTTTNLEVFSCTCVNYLKRSV